MRIQNDIKIPLPAILGLSAGAAKAAADVIAKASLAVTPDDPATGGTDLRRSQKVTVEQTATGVRAAISYGTRQAVPQHQRMDYRHRPGQQAKYLEQPLHANAALAFAAAARAMRAGIGK